MATAPVTRRAFVATATAALAPAPLWAGPAGVRQIWSDARTSHLGAPSPDGKLVSIVDPATGDLAVRETATGAVRRLTGNPPGSPEFAYFSAFSRDGRSLAYARFNRDRIYELRVIAIDGTGRRILHSHPERRFVQPCAWSADGKRILTLFFRADNVSQIALVDTASGTVEVLQSLDWIYPNKMDLSPDGKWIAYDDLIEAGGARRTIHLLATDGSARRTLLKTPLGETFPLFTPKGDAVLYLRGGSVYRHDLATGRETLRQEVGQALPMGITKRGDYYYAVRNNRYSLQIGDMGAEPGPGRPFSASLPVINVPPAWSPDGKRIAFLARAAHENFGQESRLIVLREVDGTAGTVLPPKLAHVSWVRWMADGKSLLAGGSDRHGQRGLYRIEIATGEVSALVREPADTYDGFEGLPWQQNEAIYLQGGQLRRTGAEAPLYAAPAGRLHSLTGRGQQVAFVLETAATRDLLLWDTRGTRRLTAWKGDPILGLEWHGNHLLTQTKDGLWRIALEDGAVDRLPWKINPSAMPRLAPDARRLAWIDGSSRTEIWVAERMLDASDH